MLTKTESKSKVIAFLNHVYIDFETMIVDKYTIENDMFFVFFYNSKEYHLNHNDSYALAGNGGIFVDRIDGTIY